MAQEIPGQPIFISAPEYQVLDNANHPDAKLGVDGNRQSASLYDMIPAKPQNAKPFGEWNTAKIMVYNGTVVHYQNGEQVLEYHLWTPQWKEMLDKSKFSKEKWPEAYDLLINCGGENHEGYIGLQDHGDNVWFRNIRVKELLTGPDRMKEKGDASSVSFFDFSRSPIIYFSVYAFRFPTFPAPPKNLFRQKGFHGRSPIGYVPVIANRG